MPFTDEERRYLEGHAIGRLATVSATGEPDIAAVSYHLHGGEIRIGGLDVARSIKYRNILATGKVAFVVDDIDESDRRGPRGLKIHGRGEIITGPGGSPEIRVRAGDVWSWGLNRRDEHYRQDEPFVQEMGMIEDAGISPV